MNLYLKTFRNLFLLFLLFLLVFVTTSVTLAGQTPARAESTRLSGTPPPSNPEPDAVTAPDRTTISEPGPGLYIASGSWSPFPNPGDYSAIGAYNFFHWSKFNPSDGVYDWGDLDYWIDQQIDAGYQTLGMAMVTYTNRYASCPDQGVDATPKWVQSGPDGVFGNGDDTVFVASDPDTRNCDGDGVDDPWYLLDYRNSYFNQKYRDFIHALAAHLANHPQGYRFKWIAIATGKDGENTPSNNQDDDDYQNRGMYQQEWIDWVNSISDMYRDAFADANGNYDIQVLTQNAPFYLSSWERRDIADYAAGQGVGVSINAITADFNFTNACSSTSTYTHCSGMWDQAYLHNDTVPIGFEGYGYMTGTENEFYWEMSRSLDARADYIRLSSFWNYSGMDTANNRTIAEWAAKYLGTGLLSGQKTPPSIWSRAWEHRRPCFYNYAGQEDCDYYPPVGNSEFFLTQLHSVGNGTTIPVTDDNRVTGMGWSGVDDQPWHYNSNPYDANVNGAGLYHLNSNGSQIQIEVDPGWSTRRTDQVSDNFVFFYAADDRYVSPATGIDGEHNTVIITITYLDHGTDTWRLIYDGGDGQKTAKVVAINDWNIRRGLAIDPGLPDTGRLDPRPSYVTKTNTGGWKVATFLITDGYFGNGLSGGADFFIDSRAGSGDHDGDEYINHVDLQQYDEMTVGQVDVSLTDSGALLQWSAAPGAVDHYEIWRSESFYFAPGDAGAVKLADIPANGTLSYTDSPGGGGNIDVNYSYLVLAVDADGLYSDRQQRPADFDFPLVTPQ